MRLTNSSEHTLRPVPTGRLSRRRLKIEMVMGRHHASGRSSHPCEMHPKMRKTLATVLIVSSSCLTGVGGTTLRPHLTHTTASSTSSAPQCGQYFIFPPIRLQRFHCKPFESYLILLYIFSPHCQVSESHFSTETAIGAARGHFQTSPLKTVAFLRETL